MSGYRVLGCSQEDHLPNCGHFGYAGTYLSPHLVTCPKSKGNVHEDCNCNPKARAAKAMRDVMKLADAEWLHPDWMQVYRTKDKLTFDIHGFQFQGSGWYDNGKDALFVAQTEFGYIVRVWNDTNCRAVRESMSKAMNLPQFVTEINASAP